MTTEQGSSVSFPALGTTAVVAVTESAALGQARTEVEEIVDAFDRTCSRFREDSELSAVNAGAGRSVQASPLLLECVAAALRAAQVTDGDVDPTVGGALIALGYDRDFEALSGAAHAAGRVSIVSAPGWRSVQIDSAAGTIRIAHGVKLDLGATAKALASDHAAAAASSATGCGVLVSLGGDIATAGPPPPTGWRIRVTDDHRADSRAPGQWITVRSGGLATSSTTVRRWRIGSDAAHHLVDPATGGPAEIVWRTVSVTAASCLDANIASTAAVIRGRRAVEWLTSLGLPSRLVAADRTVRHVAGWPTDGDDLPVAEDMSG